MTPEFSLAERDLLKRATAWLGPRQLSDLNDELLCELSRTKGIDFATATLYQVIRSSEAHGRFGHRINELLQKPPTNYGGLDAALVVAPGAFYREHPETGADGKHLCRIAAELGCRTYAIPTYSIGTAFDNGQVICDWLSRSVEEKIILCSLSKGGADVKMALATPQARDAFCNVAAWINVGGVTSGSPMATWILGRLILSQLYRGLFWWRGQDFRFVREIARRPGSALDFQISVPPHMAVIHVVGFPLASHLRARPTGRWHRRLSRFGPNDGATILADCGSVPGLIFPVWGEDHYLNMRYSPETLLATLLYYLGNELNLFATGAPRDHVAADVITS
jgi:hypothetical protein